MACKQGDIERARMALEGGADINVLDAQQYTPLMDAVLNGKFAMAKFGNFR